MWNEACQGTSLQYQAASNFTWLWISQGHLRQSHEICGLLISQIFIFFLFNLGPTMLSAAIPRGQSAVSSVHPWPSTWQRAGWKYSASHSFTHIFLFSKIIISSFRNAMHCHRIRNKICLYSDVLPS